MAKKKIIAWRVREEDGYVLNNHMTGDPDHRTKEISPKDPRVKTQKFKLAPVYEAPEPDEESETTEAPKNTQAPSADIKKRSK